MTISLAIAALGALLWAGPPKLPPSRGGSVPVQRPKQSPKAPSESSGGAPSSDAAKTPPKSPAGAASPKRSDAKGDSEPKIGTTTTADDNAAKRGATKDAGSVAKQEVAATRPSEPKTGPGPVLTTPSSGAPLGPTYLADGPSRWTPTTRLQMAHADEIAMFEEDDLLAGRDSTGKVDAGAPQGRKPGDKATRAKDERVKGIADSDKLVVRSATEAKRPPRLTFKRRPHPPKKSASFVFGYRQFTILDGLGRQQSWHAPSIELTPLRRYFRLNLLTEFGIEGGAAARSGDRADFMIVQKVGVGAQYPYWVTPFVEFQGGAGAARVELFERNDIVFLYTLGLDFGAQFAVTKWLFLHAAIGWLRPTFRRSGGSVHFDRVAFKVGFGF